MKFFGLLVLLALAVAEDPDATATFQQLCTSVLQWTMQRCRISIIQSTL